MIQTFGFGDVTYATNLLSGARALLSRTMVSPDKKFVQPPCQKPFLNYFQSSHFGKQYFFKSFCCYLDSPGGWMKG
jgi:hypothetical protein